MPSQYLFARPLTTHALILPRPPHPPIQPPRAFSQARLGKQYKAFSTCKAAWLPKLPASYQHHSLWLRRCLAVAQQLHSSRSRAAAVVEVAAALIEKDNSFLIAKRIEGDDFENKWEFPGGKLELGETPFMAIEREIKEELAINVRAVSHVGTWYHQLIDKEICLHLIKCESDSYIDIASTKNLTAHSQLVWHPNDELLEIEWIGSDKKIAQFLQRL